MATIESTKDISLEKLAVHFVDRKNNDLKLAKSEYDTQSLDSRVEKFLIDLIDKVWDAEEKASMYSGKFALPNDPKLSLTTKKHIEDIRNDRGIFFEITKNIATHLYQQSSPNASPGLLT